MDNAITFLFFGLIICGPWVSRKWGMKGELIWGMIAMAFLTTMILFVT